MAERFNESAPLKTSVRCLVLFSLSCRQHWTSEYYVSSSQYILTLWAMDGGGEVFLHIKTMEGNVKFVVNREPPLPIGWICHGGCSERFGKLEWSIYYTIKSHWFCQSCEMYFFFMERFLSGKKLSRTIC